MALEPGTRLGLYEVIEPIGAPSDERYKASDTRSQQVVALKILPPEFAAHSEIKARLERNTKTISSLNHPRICPIVDVGHQDPATDFVVSEFVEGETLTQLLARGPLELNQALPVVIAIADSLDKAHRRGVVHGGLNPSVVLLTAEGPKLLDLGVANVGAGGDAPSTTSMATTQTSVASLLSVPTFVAPYMAPEQFAGVAIDARTDIYSLGAMLYEMVTGKPVFQEKTQALLIAAVQTVDPEPVSKAQPSTPPDLDYLIARCLNKDPKQRFQTAFDLMTELQWIARDSTAQERAFPTPVEKKRRDRAVWIGVAVASALALTIAPSTFARFERAPEPAEVRFVATTLPGGTAPITLSPDGHWLSASTNAGPVIGMSLDSVTPQTLVSGVPYQPFWSPDSRSMAYFDDGQLKRVDIGGGPPQIICDAPSPVSAGTWNRDGVILFPGARLIQRVLAAGGQPTPITTLDESKQETEHVAPVFLPDGRRFLFLAVSSKPGESAIYVGSVDSTERTRLFAADSRTVYAAPGYLLFNRGDTVFAHAFDADTLTFRGEPIRVASGVTMLAVAGTLTSPSHARWATFAVSQTGVLAYRTGGAASPGAPAPGTPEEQRSLFWLDRTGQRSASIAVPGGYEGLDLSPDGKRFAVHRHEGTGGDNWFFDVSQQRMQRLTFDTTQDNSSPIWSPEGTRIAFASRRSNKWGLYVKPVDGTAAEELITESDVQKSPMSWSPDGKLLVYTQNTGANDIWAVPVTGEKKPFPLVQSQFPDLFPQVSPDGKWMAYVSLETGRPEVYIKSFPDGPVRRQVSTDGGLFPRWRRDGSELYFYFANNMIAADIRAAGSSLEPGAPRTLFSLADPGGTNHVVDNRFAVSADGQRFLVSQPGIGGPGGGGAVADQVLAAAESGAIAANNGVTVVLNWTQMLKEK